MNKDHILVATFTHPHEAIFIKGTLANFGIPSFLKSDQRQFSNPFYKSPVARRRLFIYRKDIPGALSVFDQVKVHGHFTILLNKSHLKLCRNKATQTNPDKKICWICACIYAAIIISVLVSLLSSLSIF